MWSYPDKTWALLKLTDNIRRISSQNRWK